MTSKQRVIEAAELLHQHYGISADLEALRRSGAWQDAALVIIAECLAALATEAAAAPRRSKRSA